MGDAADDAWDQGMMWQEARIEHEAGECGITMSPCPFCEDAPADVDDNVDGVCRDCGDEVSDFQGTHCDTCLAAHSDPGDSP